MMDDDDLERWYRESRRKARMELVVSLAVLAVTGAAAIFLIYLFF
jgi:Tfp pilus assembly protein PilN